MKFKNLLVIAGACILSLNAESQWASKQNMTVPSGASGISAVQSFSLGGKIYAGGGYYTMFTNTNDLHVYDPALNTWTPKGDLPGAPDRSAGIAFSINGKGYIGLGAMGWSSLSYTYLADLWMYDPQTNTWTQKASLPDSGRHSAGWFVANNKVYVVGGSVDGSTTSDVWEYDPAGDTWTAKGPYPLGKIKSPFSWGSATKGYISCGYSAPSYRRATYEYTPTTDTWALRDSFPGAAGSDGVSFVLNGKGYCGLSRAGSVYDTSFYAYDMTTNTWGPAIPFTHGGRANAMAATVNNKAYVGTGWKPASSTVYFKDWYEYPTTVGVATMENSQNFDIYPNPAQGWFVVSTQEEGEYELYDVSGQKLISGHVAGETVADVKHLPAGLYFIKLTTPKGITTQKLQLVK